MKNNSFLKVLIYLALLLFFIAVGFFLFYNIKKQLFPENVNIVIEEDEGEVETLKEEVLEKIFDPKLLSWKAVVANAEFQKRDAHTVNVFKDKFWLFGGVGGAAPDYTKNLSDIWNSVDGKTWVKVSDKALWGPRRAHETVVFNDKIWIIGGVTTNERYLNDVWSSEDGVTWTQVTKAAQWLPRKGFASVVYDNKMWVMGGVSTRGAENDVWSSEDGITWTLVTGNAGWTKRYDLAVEEFQGKMWMTGGAYPGEMGQSDVWNSVDGKNWIEVAKTNVWPGRHGYCLIEFNDYLFIIGGWSGYAHGYNDAWYSKDGITWEALYKDKTAPWLGREDLECVVFDNKLFMTGGMKTGGDRTNDVWVLSEN